MLKNMHISVGTLSVDSSQCNNKL